MRCRPPSAEPQLGRAAHRRRLARVRLVASARERRRTARTLAVRGYTFRLSASEVAGGGWLRRGGGRGWRLPPPPGPCACVYRHPFVGWLRYFQPPPPLRRRWGLEQRGGSGTLGVRICNGATRAFIQPLARARTHRVAEQRVDSRNTHDAGNTMPIRSGGSNKSHKCP